MEKDKEQTVVVFRKYKNGDILALLPHEVHNQEKNECMSYMHVGQHSGADYAGCMKDTKAASEEEYKSLFIELTNIGYNLKVMKRKRVKAVSEVNSSEVN